MSYFSKFVYTSVLMLALCGLGLASQNSQSGPKPAADSAIAADGSITDEQLGKMLEGMGYDAKVGTYTNGTRFYDVKVQTKDFDFNIRIGHSPNKRSIWLMAYLGDVPANVTVEQLQALLRAVNTKTGKMQFRMTGMQLKADQPLDNVAVSPSRLKREIDDFAAALSDTGDLWQFKTSVKAAAK